MSNKFSKGKKKKRYIDPSAQFDYLVHFPENCIGNYIIMSKPRGLRCVLKAQSGLTSVTDRDGSILLSCKTILPDGSPKTIG